MFELTAEPNLSMAAAARRTEGRGAAAPEAHQEGRDYFDMRTVHGE